MATVEERNVEAYRMLALIVRHGWFVMPPWMFGDGTAQRWHVKSRALEGEHPAHRAPTLTEALTAASRCSRCTGGE